MCMTRAGLDAAELELRGHDSAVVPAQLWIVILQQQQQQQVDDVLRSPFAEDWTVGGCEQNR